MWSCFLADLDLALSESNIMVDVNSVLSPHICEMWLGYRQGFAVSNPYDCPIS